MRQRRRDLERDSGAVRAILADGAQKARVVAMETMSLVRRALKLTPQ